MVKCDSVDHRLRNKMYLYSEWSLYLTWSSRKRVLQADVLYF